MKTLLFITCLIACISVQAQKEIENSYGKATMYVNNEYSTRNFEKVLVRSGINDPDIDKKICDEFKELGIIAVSAMTLLPPVKEYTAEEIQKICEQNKIDGVVIVERKGYEPGVMSNKNKTNLTLTIQDLNQKLNAVTFVGSVIRFSDKANLHFVKLAIPELKTIIRKV